jgi:hypothetical protein
MLLSELILAMQPSAPAEVEAAAKDLQYRHFLTVALVVPQEFAFPDNWIYIHDPEVKVGRIQNFGAWSPFFVKDGRTCLGTSGSPSGRRAKRTRPPKTLHTRHIGNDNQGPADSTDQKTMGTLRPSTRTTSRTRTASRGKSRRAGPGVRARVTHRRPGTRAATPTVPQNRIPAHCLVKGRFALRP